MQDSESPGGSSAEGADHEAPAVVTREVLYNMVWSQPMLRIAAGFGVSSSYMARVCSLLRVPRPERGYWAKLAVGKVGPKPSLPPARPGDELAWTRGESGSRFTPPLPKAPEMEVVSPRRSKLRPARPGARQHPLVTGVKTLFESGRRSNDVGYLKPSKKLLVDLAVTAKVLGKALAFANDLFTACETQGYRVVIAPHGERLHRVDFDTREVPNKVQVCRDLWTPYRPTVVYVGTLAIGLTIFEMSEELEVRHLGGGKYVPLSEYVAPKRGREAFGWTSKQDVPSGRLCLQAYSPYWQATWSRQWREAKDHDLTGLIPTIVTELEEAALELVRLVEDGERKAELDRQRLEEQWERWRQEEEEKRRAKALKESSEDLHQIIEDWSEAMRIESYFVEVESRIGVLPKHEQGILRERLREARGLAGSLDPLERFKMWKTPEER